MTFASSVGVGLFKGRKRGVKLLMWVYIWDFVEKGERFDSMGVFDGKSLG